MRSVSSRPKSWADGLEGAVMKPYDPLDPEVRRDPFEYFREFQRTCPVYHHVYPDTGLDWSSRNPMVSRPTADFYQVFDHADITRILQNHEVFSSRQGTGPERADPPNGVGMLIFADPPHHTQQRKIVNKALTPRLVAAMEPRIAELAHELVDGFASAGRVDIATAYCEPLPSMVFAGILGVPVSEVGTFKRWADEITAGFGGDEAAHARALVAMDELSVYFGGLVAARRSALAAGEKLPDDLLTALITSDYDGRTFDDVELILALHILVAGGNETTGSALVNGIYQLCSHPAQLAAVRDDPELLPAAVEEILRFEASPQCQFRTANVDVEIAGVPMPADSKIAMMYGAGNRDPKVFTDPDRFDVTRDIRELRQHLSFGRGIHACVGMALARAQLRIGLQVLLSRLPGLRLDPDRPGERYTTILVRRFSSLPVCWSLGADPC
jgi:cytochrome P450